MAPDLSAVSNSTMARPRAATTAPAMVSQSPTPRQPVHGPHTSATLPPGSPPLGTGDYGITSTAQGKSAVAGVTSMSIPD
jgi:Tfp pilus assembly protein FimV